MTLLVIHTTPLGPGLPSLATFLFNEPVHGIMPVLDRKPVSKDYDEHQSKLVDRQHKNNNDAYQSLHLSP